MDRVYYPPYRHMEIYEWAEEYMRHRYFRQRDYDDEYRLRELYARGQADFDRAAGADDRKPDIVGTGCFNYTDRYGAWRQDTRFFRNFFAVDVMRREASSYPELVLKCEAACIPARAVNFVLSLSYFARRRLFAFDYAYPELMPSQDAVAQRQAWAGDYEDWTKLQEMRREACAGGHDCATYAEFVERDFPEAPGAV